jgi:hypothetical protein
MRQLAIFIGSLLMIAVSVLAQSASQDKVEISTNPPPPAMPFPVVKELGKAKARYNERADKLIVQTSPIQVSGDSQNDVRLQAGFILSGKKITKPQTITLTFHSTANDRTYADNRAVSVMLDDNKVLSETARYNHGNTNGSIFLISVTQDVSYETFLKIMAAQKVQMQIGPTKFELKANGRQALEDLKNLIEHQE